MYVPYRRNNTVLSLLPVGLPAPDVRVLGSDLKLSCTWLPAA